VPTTGSSATASASTGWVKPGGGGASFFLFCRLEFFLLGCLGLCATIAAPRPRFGGIQRWRDGSCGPRAARGDGVVKRLRASVSTGGCWKLPAPGVPTREEASPPRATIDIASPRAKKGKSLHHQRTRGDGAGGSTRLARVARHDRPVCAQEERERWAGDEAGVAGAEDHGGREDRGAAQG
jgi:hypothetical protein